MSFPTHLQTFYFGERAIEIFVPDAKWVKEKYKEGKIDFPFWSKVWPASIALAKFIYQHPVYVNQKTVIELGAGLGLPSIVAAGFASSVLCSDYISEAVELINRSAAHNHLQYLTASLIDWHSLPANIEAEVLLLSDVNYEPEIFLRQQQLINHFLEKNTVVILSTPHRLMAKEFMLPLLSYCQHKEDCLVMEEGKKVVNTIFVLRKNF